MTNKAYGIGDLRKQFVKDLDPIHILNVQPTCTIQIKAENGKTLTLDFNDGKLKTYGDLPYDKASKKFFEAFDNFFQIAIEQFINKQKKKKK